MAARYSINPRTVRWEGIFAAYDALPKMPCGCKPKLKTCDCPHSCWCEVDLEFCDHWDEWPAEELQAIGEALAAFFTAGDPHHHGEPPVGLGLIEYTWREARIEKMRDRVAMGFSPFHAADIRAADIGQGETVYTKR
jgi:hypothetical protein